MKPPKGSEEPMPGGAPDKGIGVVEVSSVDSEEVCAPDDRGGRDPNPSLRDFLQEVGGGFRSPPCSGPYGGCSHGVHHPEVAWGGRPDTGELVEGAMAVGDEPGHAGSGQHRHIAPCP